jgi:catechol 2,3-dioxygenase-like lactoylglutathione lyase family enzyme
MKTSEEYTLTFENVALSVCDLDKAVSWYREILGFELVKSEEFAYPVEGKTIKTRWAVLKGNGLLLELISTGKAQKPSPLPEPPAHLDTTGDDH